MTNYPRNNAYPRRGSAPKGGYRPKSSFSPGVVDHRPEAWTRMRPVHTLWLDYKTGAGVTDSGAPMTVAMGGRRTKQPNLQDFVTTAQAAGAARIMLCGPLPTVTSREDHWLLKPVAGFKMVRSHLNRPPYSAKFAPTASSAQAAGLPVDGEPPTWGGVEIRSVSEWFGTQELTPAQAYRAWHLTEELVSWKFPQARLALTPSATGANCWAITLHGQRSSTNPAPVTSDIAEEIHRTSGQHRIEHLVAGENSCPCDACRPMIDPKVSPELPAFAYVDGRFMYAACCRELGTGPGVRYNRADTAQILDDPKGLYKPIRVLARFTVPRDWNHVGMLGVQHTNPADGWHYPNTPGASFETWIGGPEYLLALQWGWSLEPLESVVFNNSGPVLDTWAKNLVDAREQLLTPGITDDIAVRNAVGAALRAILLQGVGNFARRNRGTDITTTNPAEIPAELQGTVRRHGDSYTYTIPGREPTARDLALYHPEIAAQVWSRARARVLSFRLPTEAQPPEGAPRFTGLLSMDPSTIIGVQGDAILATELPWWSLPISAGGGDDGKVGRLRATGYLPGPLPTPVTIDQRHDLRRQAEAAGLRHIRGSR